MAVDPETIALATSYANAQAGVTIPITGSGASRHADHPGTDADRASFAPGFT